MVVSFVISFLFNTVLSKIFTSIRSLALMVHFFTISLMFPANCLNFFSSLLPLVIFDVFPTTSIMNDIFKFTQLQEDPSLSFQFDQLGYRSMNIVENMGSIYLIIWLYPIAVLTAFSISKILSKITTKIKFVKTIEMVAK